MAETKERTELITKAQQGDTVAYEKLLSDDLKLIFAVVDIYKKYASLSKLMTAALEGWNKALENYHKPEIKFAAYSIWWIKEMIHRSLKVETMNLDGHGTNEEATQILNKVYGKGGKRVNF